MEIQNPPLKIFVDPDDKVLIVCPECNFSKNFSTKQFRNRQFLLKIKCKCGHCFTVQLEARLHIRKKTEIEGICKFRSTGTSAWKVILINLSLGGVCLELKGNHILTVGDKGILEFTLDDRKATAITKQIVVKGISTNLIRCEFIEDRAYQKAMGFYLRP